MDISYSILIPRSYREDIEYVIKKPPTRQSRLEQLPFELREQIYGYLGFLSLESYGR
jgi:hypothetical protein